MKLYLVLIASVLSCFTASSNAGGITVNVHRIESTRSRLIRTGKWGAYQDLKSAIRSSGKNSNSQPLIDYEDGEYIAHVNIGTPPQRFLMLLSLNTASLWVPDKTCPSSKCPSYCNAALYCKYVCDPRCCSAKSAARVTPAELKKAVDCGWRNLFDSAKSSTYKKNGTHFNDSLSVAVNAVGFVGIDTVTLGDTNALTVTSQTFGQVTSALFDVDQAYDGVLGIGIEWLALPGMEPLLYNAKRQGVIQKYMVTVALIREGIQSPDLPGGTITYGDVDTKNCGPDVTYLEVNGDPTIASLDGVSFGGFEAPRTSGDVWKASFGFGNTVLNGSTKVMDGLAQAAGAVKGEYGGYVVQCNATLPSLFLTLNGHRFEIPGSELVRAQVASDPNYCIFNVYGSDLNPGSFSLGAALARKYCLVFDYDHLALGFSENLYRSPSSG